MHKEMLNEEFIKCHSYNVKEINQIRQDLEDLGIADIDKRLEYIRGNYYGQLYLAYAFEEIDNIMLKNFKKVDDYITLSSSAIDGILRAFCFAIKYLQPGLPGHAHNYMISKSSTLISELINYYNKNNLQ